MRLGAKLDVGFSTQEVYRQLFAAADALELFRQLGFTAIETPVGVETEATALWEHVERCHAAGFRVSLHPYSEGTPANVAWFTPEPENPCRQLHEQFLTVAARIAELQGGPTVVNVHPAAAVGVPRDVQLSASLAFFSWCRQWCDARQPAVRVVAELQIAPNTDETMLRIGDHYAELLEIARHSGVGLTWDVGHAVLNHLRFETGLWPPGEFLLQVAHIHCHDVDQSDHQPLLFDTVPWREYLARAVSAGFDGTVILEIPPQHYVSAGGLSALLESAARLRETQARLAATA